MEEKKVPPQKIPPPGGIRVKKKTQHEKRTRQSGKNTDKPYISSSIGDMCRLMMRMACTENTLNMTEPPPVEFYDFWHKFKITPSKDMLPHQYIDTAKVSVPRIKMNTSSYELFAKAQASAASMVQVENSSGNDRRHDPTHKLFPALSDLWRGVRISMSGESFISSSTKVSEKQENVELEGGWSDDEEGEELLALLLSDSEDETGASNASVAGGGVAPVPQGGMHPPVSSVTVPGSKVPTEASLSKVVSASSAAADSSYQEMDEHQKELGAVAASILHMEVEEARVAMEHAIKASTKNQEVIDHFMNNLDDSFLIDAVSYGLLPDTAFTSDFDYFNEDPIYREKERAEAVALLEIKKEKRSSIARLSNSKNERGKVGRKSASDTTLDISEEESDVESLATVVSQVPIVEKEDYKTCIAKQKKRIEDKIKAAAAMRDPMGKYIVPEGEMPLARTFMFNSPGAGAYYPNINAVKPGPVGVFLTKGWDKRHIYETLGPGPGAYNLQDCNKCTARMNNLHFADRFETNETVGPGPSEYNVLRNDYAGKDKPHALVLSRLPAIKIGCGGSKFVNVFGLNRFGKRSSPNPLILSRHVPKDKWGLVLGPGEYDAYVEKETKVGITMKSRIPPLGEQDISPGFVNLPSLIGTGPGVPLGIRNFTTQSADSPGPIYLLPNPEAKPVSMTFKPFPVRGREDEPSPIHYGIRPGLQAIKTKPRAPTPKLIGTHDLRYGDPNTPGPKYKLEDCKCKVGITMKGRYPTKTDTTPGPCYNVGTSHLRVPPKAVFQHKWKEDKIVFDERSSYEPHNITSRVKGGLMAPRWPQKESEKTGAGFHDLFGFTTKGKYSKIPISFKSRQSPFIFTHVSTNAEVPKRSCDVNKISSSTGMC